MKKIEINRMETIQGGSCLETFLASCLAFQNYSVNPNPWSWAAYGLSAYAVFGACF
jgi:hypothetical protein